MARRWRRVWIIERKGKHGTAFQVVIPCRGRGAVVN